MFKNATYSTETMEPTLYTFQGAIPSKKNRKKIIQAGSRPLLVPSLAYSEWEERELWKLAGVRFPADKLERCVVQLEFWDKLNKDGSKPKRKFDLTNKTESVMDLLVEYGTISDDNYAVCPEIHLWFIGFRDEPGCQLTLWPVRSVYNG
jgi:hypothetical protein